MHHYFIHKTGIELMSAIRAKKANENEILVTIPLTISGLDIGLSI